MQLSGGTLAQLQESMSSTGKSIQKKYPAVYASFCSRYILFVCISTGIFNKRNIALKKLKNWCLKGMAYVSNLFIVLKHRNMYSSEYPDNQYICGIAF